MGLSALAPDGARSDAIVRTLVAWRSKLASAHLLRTFRDDCAAAVALRCAAVGGGDGEYVVTSNDAILNAVTELVSREAAAASTDRMYTKGEALLTVRRAPYMALRLLLPLPPPFVPACSCATAAAAPYLALRHARARAQSRAVAYPTLSHTLTVVFCAYLLCGPTLYTGGAGRDEP